MFERGSVLEITFSHEENRILRPHASESRAGTAALAIIPEGLGPSRLKEYHTFTSPSQADLDIVSDLSRFKLTIGARLT